MALLWTLPEAFSWMCDGELDFSTCTQSSIIDGLNLLFLCSFYVLWIAITLRKRNANGNSTRRDLVLIVVVVCCAFSSLAHFGVALRSLILQADINRPQSWLLHFVRGLIWMSLTGSLLAAKSKWMRTLVTLWWVAFCLLVTAQNIRLLLKGLGIGVLDIVTWPINFLLMFCAFRKYVVVLEPNPDEKLYEPLLGAKPDDSRSQLGCASCLSKLTFSWINPLLRLGYSKLLEFKDIPSLISEDEADLAYKKFALAWDSVVSDQKGSQSNLVIKTIAKVYFQENIFIGLCALSRTISVVISPLLLYWFVNYSNGGGENLSEGFTIIGCLMLAKLVESFSQRHYFFDSRRSGMRMRSALMVAVYKKQLKLSNTGRKRHSTGEIVNYIAVDAYRMGEFPWWFHSTWSLTLQLFLSIGVLFAVIGIGALPGLVPLLICGLLNVPFAKILQNCQSQFMTAQDERLRSTSEILNSMKIIKLQSWEERFRNLIESRRATEMKWLAEAQFKRVYGTVLYWMSPTIISSVIFLGCALLQSAPLNASTIFTVLATLRAMGEPVRMIPEALSILIQMMVSFDRINTFLVDDELKNDRIREVPLEDSSSTTSIQILSGNFAWDVESAILTLKDINLEAKCGQKIAVCGPVGAGKSSLLCAILGEITKTTGTVKICGSTAYVSQTSWIQSGTIRDNILYGKPMDEVRYKKAIKACALDKDISSFGHGDLTEIGQRGLNMSGGQKQRIQLARAVYNDTDIYLLDDPFSAVDAHTAAILFNDCVMGVLENKMVILVTHQVEFLSDMDRILLMEEGRVTQSGSYQELLTAGTAFEQLVNAHKEVLTTFGPSNSEIPGETANSITFKHEESKEAKQIEISEKAQPGVQLTEEEEKEIGDAGWKPFWDYIMVSKGLTLLFLGFLTQLAFVALQAASTFWLAVAIQFPDISSGTLIGVFAGISSLSAVFVYLRSFFGAHLGLKASKAFFSGFTDSIFKAPMLFFDSTPVGRILTRASSDLSILDFDIPFSIIFVIAAGIELLTIIGIMASVTWQVLIVATFAMVAAKYVQAYYLASARELIRINGTTKAPLMNYAAETSLGVVTVRAFNAVDRFFCNFLKLVDADAKLLFHSNALMEWLVLRIEVLQNLTLLTASLLLILLPQGYVPPGLVGLSLSYAFTLTGTHVFVTRWYCYLSNYIISVERIKQFMHIPSEPAAVVENHRPPSSWPSKGRIELQELKLRYRPNAPLVLKGITCTFKEGSRVGVVGRTGSGKTTLISALFRLVEPASGKIYVDGLDITSIGLKDLRMKLSIIPQEATLFRGSVRSNMDPLGLYSDHEIWMALEKCQLKATISSLPNQLDSSVSDEGENWSAGQRQLFCLGRVLLRRNRVLVLDEATASIDSTTDAVLQRIIRQEFSDCTVITVAHRVPTVIDSDMVMVLSYGNLVEYEEPSELMETDSYFSKLVAEYWSSCRRSSSHSL
ncbi:ABC transporter C family member 8-like [Syzygium oleosum]|uniref:ABC transporter C family member 8-like n=1 Tax=Syzygium oleosum TaxID=219896 RepID=UPI0011D1CED5|nr:ABC transporter C family member 8-like [Syzygium oleosum]